MTSEIQFEYDPERLIEEVKKRPGIWDYEDIEYRTKNMRHKLWTEIVKELITPDVKVSKSDMRELELQLQKKWKSIRDCFHKYMTNPKNKTKRPYIYSRQLQFLLKNETEAASSGSDSGHRPTKNAWRPKKKIKLTKDSSEEEDTMDNEDYMSNSGMSYEVPLKHLNTSNKPIDEFAFANVDNNQSRNEPEDPDKMFLLSLLPHLKSIPEEMRLNVKVDLMQVLRSGNYQTLGDHKIM